MTRSILWTLCLLLSVGPQARAAKVRVWHHHASSHYEKAQLKQTVISNEGALRLSRQLKPLAALDATHIWAVVEDKNANLYLATGPEGKIFKVTPAGKVSVVFDSEESQILCLAKGPDGSIYAGTGPSGLIVRIAPDGNAKVIYDSPESYVWSLAVDSKGEKIYAGTGPKGRLYQVTPDGKGSIFYTTKQEHILSVATGPDGMVYAGTDKNGLVYRIDPRGKGFVLYNAPQTEVRSLMVTAEGIYAGTSSPTRRHRGSTSASSEERSSGSVRISASPVSMSKGPAQKASEDIGKPSSSGPGHSSKDKDEEKGASAPPSPASGENSLYRIAFDGTVREVFREKAMILCQLQQDGRIYIGTGMEGQLFEVEESSKERSEIARLDHGQIHCMCRRRDGSIVLGTGDPGKLYVLQDRFTSSGTVVSEVLDAKIISKWGSLRWQADTPPDTKITVAVRTGNISEPDETWSDWSTEETDAQQATIRAPTARFLQYRVTLKTNNAATTPALRGLALRYVTTNQAPEITSIDVPDIDAVNLDNPKRIKFKWNAVDPNEDELTYALYVRKDGWKNWVRLEDELEKKEYEWDTTTTPSGTYHVKIVASDARDNSAEEALKCERISGPFVVAHAPPAVTVKVVAVERDQAVIEATAVDPLVRLTAASFAVNGKKWINVFPTDGLFDSKTESFKFKTHALKPGTYVLVLRVSDAAGNTGSGDVVFVIPGRETGK